MFCFQLLWREVGGGPPGVELSGWGAGVLGPDGCVEATSDEGEV